MYADRGCLWQIGYPQSAIDFLAFLLPFYPLLTNIERKKIMKYRIQLRWILVALSIMVTTTLIVATLGLSGEESAKEPAAPQIIAVKFHADW